MLCQRGTQGASSTIPLIDRLREKSASNLHGILPVHLGFSMSESAQAGGRMSPRGQFGGVVDSGP